MRITDLLTFNRGRTLCLPAHGRGSALPTEIRQLLRRPAGVWDLPELPDIGGPLTTSGAVSESQKMISDSFGADRCWYGVNGATGLLQAALFAVLKPGQAVLMPRNVHKSLIEACAIGDFTPILFDIPFLKDRGHFSNPDSFWLKKVLEGISNDLEIAAAVLVNPTYHGYSSQLSELVTMLHQKGLPVVIDEAHGTHFATSIGMDLPQSGLTAGADLIVHSLHKSATGLVQTAVLWMQGERVDAKAIERSISWFQTSSPSALLLASCEASVKEMICHSGLRRLKKRIVQARAIRKNLLRMGIPVLSNQDPLRLIIHTASVGISGLDADDWFLARGLIAELPEPGCLTFCLGLVDHKGLPRLFKSKWDGLIANKLLNPMPPFSSPSLPLLTAPSMNCASAWRAKAQSIPIEDSVGRISAELICPYPPGIPLVIPGEKLDKTRVQWLIEQQRMWPGQISLQLRVVA